MKSVQIVLVTVAIILLGGSSLFAKTGQYSLLHKNNNTMEATQKTIVFTDKFIVPKKVESEFQSQMNLNRSFIKNLKGFISDEVFSTTLNDSLVEYITIAKWENEECLSNAKKLVQEEYQRTGFKPDEFIRLNNIKMERQTYQTAGSNNPSSKNRLKQFNLLIRVPENYDGEKAKSVHPQWEKLLEEWKNSGVLVFSFAFPGDSYTVSGASGNVKEETILSDKQKVVSTVVIRAENIEKALELAKLCPILGHGGNVEVREIPQPITR